MIRQDMTSNIAAHGRRGIQRVCMVTANENGRRLASTGLEESGRYSDWEGMNPRKFFAELTRRHVYRVAIACGVVTWLLIQTATQSFSILRDSELGRKACRPRNRLRFADLSDYCLGL